MKIRIKGNSIRLRLTRTEVDAFGRDGYVEERTEFGRNLFLYALRRDADAKELAASFVGVKITVHVPTAIAEEWTATDRVGYENTIDTGNGKHLFVLIEKDFKCIDAPPHEDQSDNYEHPTMSCAPAEAPVAVEEVPERHPLIEYDDEPATENIAPPPLQETPPIEAAAPVMEIANAATSPTDTEDIGRHPLLEEDDSLTDHSLPEATDVGVPDTTSHTQHNGGVEL